MITGEINIIFCRIVPEIDGDFYFEETSKRLMRVVLNNKKLTTQAAGVVAVSEDYPLKTVRESYQSVDNAIPGVAPNIVVIPVVFPTNDAAGVLLPRHRMIFR